MAVSRPTLQRVITTFSSLMGVLAVSGGIYSLTNPLAFSGTIGIPVKDSTSPALPFVLFVVARNLTSGLSLLVLLYNSQQRAAGLLMMCGVVTAFVDAWTCANNGAEEGKALGHAIMGVVAGVLGGGLYRI